MQALKFNFQLSNCQLFNQWDFMDFFKWPIKKREKLLTMFTFWIKFTYLCLQQVYGIFSLIFNIRNLINGGSRGGAQGAWSPPPLFWVKKRRNDWRKAGRASKTDPQLPLALSLDPSLLIVIQWNDNINCQSAVVRGLDNTIHGIICYPVDLALKQTTASAGLSYCLSNNLP